MGTDKERTRKPGLKNIPREEQTQILSQKALPALEIKRKQNQVMLILTTVTVGYTISRSKEDNSTALGTHDEHRMFAPAPQNDWTGWICYAASSQTHTWIRGLHSAYADWRDAEVFLWLCLSRLFLCSYRQILVLTSTPCDQSRQDTGPLCKSGEEIIPLTNQYQKLFCLQHLFFSVH